ncbi:MAG: hypothetical protein HZB38_06365 [Planctomycetes bacterium]|nr:hypothetical protein [Planctomycetota bacterium]
MNLDLTSLRSDWAAAPNGVHARAIRGCAGDEQIQMQVELGVLQMAPSGRPDGHGYRRHPTALHYLQQCTSAELEIRVEDWVELDREFQQYNYRRLAYTAMVELAAGTECGDRVCELLDRAISDLGHCLGILRLRVDFAEGGAGEHAVMIPVLIFNQARLRCRRGVVQQDFEAAIDAASDGMCELEAALCSLGLDDQQRARDPGLHFLRQTIQKLRERHEIELTLRERLAKAIESEDFRLAASLRDEMRRRGKTPQPNPISSEQI